MGEYNWLLVKIKVKVLKNYLWFSGVTTSWLEANMVKEYVLKIAYDPDTEEIESISEAIEHESDVLYFQIEDKELKIPNKIAKLLESDILGIA